MGCIQASAYTGDPNAILGTYTGVNALDQCNNYCGVCCIPGCESDFANISSCSGTTELIPCGWCEYYIDENTQNYYVDTNYKITCLSGGVGGANTGPWTAETQYGYCPANHVGGCFEGKYDCSSEIIKSSGEIIDYSSDPTNPDSFISGGNPGSATSSDPCGGSYPCTKIIQTKTFSAIAVYKNPYGQYYSYEPCEVNVFGSKVDNGIWDDAYLGGSAGLFTTEAFAYCPNGTGIDPNMGAEMSGPGAYANYIPDCCSGVVNPNNMTNKDKVWILRIKGSYTHVIKYDEGNYSYDNQAAYGLIREDLCNTCVAGPSTFSGVHITEINSATSRQHDLTVYLCDTNAGTMSDISSYICEKPVPFLVPTPFDGIDWVNDGGYDPYTPQNFAPIVGTIWGFSPIGTPNALVSLVSSSCDTRIPCTTDGFTRNNQNPNDYCPPCDPFNGIVGNFRQSDGTLYIVETPTAVSASFSQIGDAIPPSIDFLDTPNIAGNVNVNYVCNDTIGQSGCADQLSSIWHSGQDCTSFDCNA